MERPPIYEEEEVHPTLIQRYTKKAIDNPFLTGGLIGLVAMCGLGAYKYKSLRAGGMSTSIFLMQLRVSAQGMVAGALTLALFKDTIQEMFAGEDKEGAVESSIVLR